MEVTNKIVHDIRGPTINIAGLSADIRRSLNELLGILRNVDSDENDGKECVVQEFVNRELHPTVQMLELSADTLCERIDSISNTLKHQKDHK